MIRVGYGGAMRAVGFRFRRFVWSDLGYLAAVGLAAAAFVWADCTTLLGPSGRAGGLTRLPGTMCSSHLADRPRTSTTIISSAALVGHPGRRLTAMLVEFPPNAYSPSHHHEAAVFVYVLKGTIRSQLQGEPAKVLGSGDSFHEPEGSIHLFAENTSETEPALVLAVFVHDEGARLVVYH